MYSCKYIHVTCTCMYNMQCTVSHTVDDYCLGLYAYMQLFTTKELWFIDFTMYSVHLQGDLTSCGDSEVEGSGMERAGGVGRPNGRGRGTICRCGV